MVLIFINGATSAGKTSIALALQARLEPHLRFGIDDAFAMMPLKLHNHPNGFFFDRDARGLVRLNHGAFGFAALRAYRRAAAAIAASGIDVIVDEVVLDATSAADWIEVLRGIDVFAIGVRCDLDELERREVARGDRLAGQARGQVDLVHSWFRYDLEIDTTAGSADASAQTVIVRMAARKHPGTLVALEDLKLERFASLMTAVSIATPDAEATPSSWVDRLPAAARPYARLARFDRPIGAWLLFAPCGWGLAAAGGLRSHGWLLAMFGVGAVAMRGAGCVYNDIVDRDLDRSVARTRDRPVASGAVSVRSAWFWLTVLALCALPVLLALRPLAAGVALGSLALVAAYPFMKRITWWPQAWLGLTFNWGVLVGWTAVAAPSWTMLLLYAAGVAWTLGYDTIYALQDLEDDALAGIKSSARALGRRARTAVAGFYAMTIALLGAGLWRVRPDPLVMLALLPAAVHLAWQVATFNNHDPARALRLFRANRAAGLLILTACAVAGS